MKIRRSSFKKIEAMFGNFVQELLPYDSDLDIEFHLENIKENCQNFIVEENGVQIGFFILWFMEEYLLINALFIKEEYRRKGYATKILDYIKKDLFSKQKADEILLHVYKENKKAVSLYIKYGFESSEILNGPEHSKSWYMVLKR